MYSKARGYTRREGRPPRAPDRDRRAESMPTDVYAASERASIYRGQMQVPPNYSGHAIVDGEERPLGLVPEPYAVDVPRPRFDDLPRVSDGGEHSQPSPMVIPTEGEETAADGTGARFSLRDGAAERRNREGGVGMSEPDGGRRTDSMSEGVSAGIEASDTTISSDAEKATEVAAPSGGSSLFRSAHFPFGHGLGFDELFLLGLILLLLRESGEDVDRGDLDETVILLGILLLCG